MPAAKPRVVTLGPMPPEKCAYALARYSRSPDSIRESLEWVRQHDAQKFLEAYYFQYGHASIADLGHLVVCFEGVSELAATEIEDEPLWDGQARSSRYQDFSRDGVVVPAELDLQGQALYEAAARSLLEAYSKVHEAVREVLLSKLERPATMTAAAYERTVRARAFDVARYLLFLGVPTNVGQVTSIRTLEKQIRRMKASPYREVRELAAEIAAACARPPDCLWETGLFQEPLAPTLARHTTTDEYFLHTQEGLAQWARENLGMGFARASEPVDLVRPTDQVADVIATLLYSVTHHSYRELYDRATSWGPGLRREVLELATRHRGPRDELLRAFRSAPYVFDIVIDIGAWRDLHRHRRCHQFRQPFTLDLGYDTPPWLAEAGVEPLYHQALQQAFAVVRQLPRPAADYLLPFATRGRFLFKMDFAEVDYVCRLRTSPKGHFSYRRVAWLMKQKMEELEPELGRLIEATPPEVEDLLLR